jgi:outer membrane protein
LRAVKRPLVAVCLFLVFSIPAQSQEAPLTIERAIALAIERNERVAIAETTVEQAEARVRLARTAFLPRLDITGNFNRAWEDPTRTGANANAIVNQTLFDARAFPLFRAARFDRDATRLNATDVRRILGFDAAASFLGTLGFEQVLLAAENRRTFAQTNLEDVRARFEAGLVSSNDVTRAELELATAVRGVAQARGDVERSRVELATIIDAPVTALAPPAALLDAADDPPAVDATTIARAQQQRADVAASRMRIEALRAFADVPNASFIPSLNLNAQARNVNDGPVANRNNEGFVGVTFAWPVFDAGVRAAERAERTAAVRGAELGLELSLREVEQDLRSAAVQLSTEQAALREATAAVRAARRNADETGELYRQGLASALELADANRQMFEAEVAEVTARFRMAVAYLTLREASGVEP